MVIKNRNEKGLRAFFAGENPHSKGVIFSRSFNDFSLVVRVSNKIAAEIIKLIKIKAESLNILKTSSINKSV